MTMQNHEAPSEKARSSLWLRLSPFLDVIGAVLIFGSWIVSHSLSQRAQEHATMHEAIIARVREFRLYDEFARRVSDIQSDLVRTQNLVEQAIHSGEPADGNPAEGGDESLPVALTWTGMSATQVRELRDFVQTLDQYARQLSSTSDVATQLIEKAKSGAQEISQAFDSARAEFDRLVEQRTRSSSPADNDRAAQEEEGLRKRVDLLWQVYDTAKQSMLHAGDELLRTAAAESSSASRLAKHCEWLSWALYAVGTLIILFGRAKSVLSTQRADGN